ncbi:MAG: hypothetical protein WC838_02315 [Candidatus Margulisiibacteriota bacterium]|jgi:preprotein translocase subunit SecA
MLPDAGLAKKFDFGNEDNIDFMRYVPGKKSSRIESASDRKSSITWLPKGLITSGKRQVFGLVSGLGFLGGKAKEAMASGIDLPWRNISPLESDMTAEALAFEMKEMPKVLLNPFNMMRVMMTEWEEKMKKGDAWQAGGEMAIDAVMAAMITKLVADYLIFKPLLTLYKSGDVKKIITADGTELSSTNLDADVAGLLKDGAKKGRKFKVTKLYDRKTISLSNAAWAIGQAKEWLQAKITGKKYVSDVNRDFTQILREKGISHPLGFEMLGNYLETNPQALGPIDKILELTARRILGGKEAFKGTTWKDVGRAGFEALDTGLSVSAANLAGVIITEDIEPGPKPVLSRISDTRSLVNKSAAELAKDPIFEALNSLEQRVLERGENDTFSLVVKDNTGQEQRIRVDGYETFQAKENEPKVRMIFTSRSIIDRPAVKIIVDESLLDANAKVQLQQVLSAEFGKLPERAARIVEQFVLDQPSKAEIESLIEEVKLKRPMSRPDSSITDSLPGQPVVESEPSAKPGISKSSSREQLEPVQSVVSNGQQPAEVSPSVEPPTTDPAKAAALKTYLLSIQEELSRDDFTRITEQVRANPNIEVKELMTQIFSGKSDALGENGLPHEVRAINQLINGGINAARIIVKPQESKIEIVTLDQVQDEQGVAREVEKVIEVEVIDKQGKLDLAIKNRDGSPLAQNKADLIRRHITASTLSSSLFLLQRDPLGAPAEIVLNLNDSLDLQRQIKGLEASSNQIYDRNMDGEVSSVFKEELKLLLQIYKKESRTIDLEKQKEINWELSRIRAMASDVDPAVLNENFRDRIHKLKQLLAPKLASAQEMTANDPLIELIEANRAQLMTDLKSGDPVKIQSAKQKTAALVDLALGKIQGRTFFTYQLKGGFALQEGRGKFINLFCGGGKTLTALDAIITQALSGKDVHLSVPNDTLAKQSFSEVKRIIGMFLGNEHIEFLAGDTRDIPTVRKAYSRTNEAIGKVVYAQGDTHIFNYMMDILEADPEKFRMPNELGFALLDEVDFPVVFEGLNPRIMSASPLKDLWSRLVKDPAQKRFYKECFLFMRDQLKGDGVDYIYSDAEKKRKQLPRLTEQGRNKVEEWAREKGYDKKNFDLEQTFHQIENSFSVELDSEGKSHFIRGNEVVLNNQDNGQLQPSMQQENGRHQAIQAQAGVPITLESERMNQFFTTEFYQLYNMLGGMSGTTSDYSTVFTDKFGIPSTNIQVRNKSQSQKDAARIFTRDNGRDTALIEAISKTTAPCLVSVDSQSSADELETKMEVLRKQGKIVQKFTTLTPDERIGNEPGLMEIIANAGRENYVTIIDNRGTRGIDYVIAHKELIARMGRVIIKDSSGGMSRQEAENAVLAELDKEIQHHKDPRTSIDPTERTRKLAQLEAEKGFMEKRIAEGSSQMLFRSAQIMTSKTFTAGDFTEAVGNSGMRQESIVELLKTNGYLDPAGKIQTKYDPNLALKLEGIDPKVMVSDPQILERIDSVLHRSALGISKGEGIHLFITEYSTLPGAVLTQLLNRVGRLFDPGRCSFYLSLEKEQGLTSIVEQAYAPDDPIHRTGEILDADVLRKVSKFMECKRHALDNSKFDGMIPDKLSSDANELSAGLQRIVNEIRKSAKTLDKPGGFKESFRKIRAEMIDVLVDFKNSLTSLDQGSVEELLRPLCEKLELTPKEFIEYTARAANVDGQALQEIKKELLDRIVQRFEKQNGQLRDVVNINMQVDLNRMLLSLKSFSDQLNAQTEAHRKMPKLPDVETQAEGESRFKARVATAFMHNFAQLAENLKISTKINCVAPLIAVKPIDMKELQEKARLDSAPKTVTSIEPAKTEGNPPVAEAEKPKTVPPGEGAPPPLPEGSQGIPTTPSVSGTEKTDGVPKGNAPGQPEVLDITALHEADILTRLTEMDNGDPDKPIVINKGKETVTTTIGQLLYQNLELLIAGEKVMIQIPAQAIKDGKVEDTDIKGIIDHLKAKGLDKGKSPAELGRVIIEGINREKQLLAGDIYIEAYFLKTYQVVHQGLSRDVDLSKMSPKDIDIKLRELDLTSKTVASLLARSMQETFQNLRRKYDLDTLKPEQLTELLEQTRIAVENSIEFNTAVLKKGYIRAALSSWAGKLKASVGLSEQARGVKVDYPLSERTRATGYEQKELGKAIQSSLKPKGMNPFETFSHDVDAGMPGRGGIAKSRSVAYVTIREGLTGLVAAGLYEMTFGAGLRTKDGGLNPKIVEDAKGWAMFGFMSQWSNAFMQKNAFFRGITPTGAAFGVPLIAGLRNTPDEQKAFSIFQAGAGFGSFVAGNAIAGRIGQTAAVTGDKMLTAILARTRFAQSVTLMQKIVPVKLIGLVGAMYATDWVGNMFSDSYAQEGSLTRKVFDSDLMRGIGNVLGNEYVATGLEGVNMYTAYQAGAGISSYAGFGYAGPAAAIGYGVYANIDLNTTVMNNYMDTYQESLDNLENNKEKAELSSASLGWSTENSLFRRTNKGISADRVWGMQTAIHFYNFEDRALMIDSKISGVGIKPNETLQKMRAFIKENRDRINLARDPEKLTEFKKLFDGAQVPADVLPFVELIWTSQLPPRNAKVDPKVVRETTTENGPFKGLTREKINFTIPGANNTEQTLVMNRYYPSAPLEDLTALREYQDRMVNSMRHPETASSIKRPEWILSEAEQRQLDQQTARLSNRHDAKLLYPHVEPKAVLDGKTTIWVPLPYVPDLTIHTGGSIAPEISLDTSDKRPSILEQVLTDYNDHRRTLSKEYVNVSWDNIKTKSKDIYRFMDTVIPEWSQQFANVLIALKTNNPDMAFADLVRELGSTAPQLKDDMKAQEIISEKLIGSKFRAFLLDSFANEQVQRIIALELQRPLVMQKMREFASTRKENVNSGRTVNMTMSLLQEAIKSGSDLADMIKHIKANPGAYFRNFSQADAKQTLEFWDLAFGEKGSASDILPLLLSVQGQPLDELFTEMQRQQNGVRVQHLVTLMSQGKSQDEAMSVINGKSAPEVVKPSDQEQAWLKLKREELGAIRELMNGNYGLADIKDVDPGLVYTEQGARLHKTVRVVDVINSKVQDITQKVNEFNKNNGTQYTLEDLGLVKLVEQMNKKYTKKEIEGSLSANDDLNKMNVLLSLERQIAEWEKTKTELTTAQPLLEMDVQTVVTLIKDNYKAQSNWKVRWAMVRLLGQIAESTENPAILNEIADYMLGAVYGDYWLKNQEKDRRVLDQTYHYLNKIKNNKLLTQDKLSRFPEDKVVAISYQKGMGLINIDQ